MTFVSVITPAYKAESFIARAVKSVLKQTHADWEMIIISDDRQDYAAILQAQGVSDPRLRFTSTGKIGAGPGVARNAGFDVAKSPIIAHLDADDAYADDLLSLTIPLAEQHGACIGSLRMIDDTTGEEKPLDIRPPEGAMLSLPGMLRYCLGYANLLIDRRRCRARWPEGLSYGEDLLFWLLLLDDIPGIAYMSSARFDYYFRKTSFSRPDADEKDTHNRCERRNQMIAWLEKSYRPGCNTANRDILKRWLLIANEIEETFNYKLVPAELYAAEVNRRFVASFGIPE